MRAEVGQRPTIDGFAASQADHRLDVVVALAHTGPLPRRRRSDENVPRARQRRTARAEAWHHNQTVGHLQPLRGRRCKTKTYAVWVQRCDTTALLRTWRSQKGDVCSGVPVDVVRWGFK